jgi:hypothetical protein
MDTPEEPARLGEDLIAAGFGLGHAGTVLPLPASQIGQPST